MDFPEESTTETLSNETELLEPEFQLYGIWIPQFDIPLIITWFAITIAGVGNTAVVLAFARYKPLRRPINVLVVGLALSDTLSTSVAAPLGIYRVLTLFRPQSETFCTVKIILKSFVFSASALFVFLFSVVRLCMGVQAVPTRLSYRQAGLLTGMVFLIAALSTPILAVKSSNSFQVCMSALTPMGERSNTSTASVSAVDVAVSTDDYTTHAESGPMTFNSSAFQPPRRNKDKRSLWQIYFSAVIILFTGTILCYAILGAHLYRRRNASYQTHQVTANKRDILTLRVASTVTLAYTISFLVPFIPAFLNSPIPNATLHFIAFFDCIALTQSAINPIIYFCNNRVYRRFLLKSLPRVSIVPCRPENLSTEVSVNDGQLNAVAPLAATPSQIHSQKTAIATLLRTPSQKTTCTTQATGSKETHQMSPYFHRSGKAFTQVHVTNMSGSMYAGIITEPNSVVAKMTNNEGQSF